MSNLSERDKMLAGELYVAADPELVAMRRRARRLVREYNQTDEEYDAARRQQLLAELLGEHGEGLHIEPPFYCDYGTHITTGRNVYMNFNCVILDCAQVRIGDRVMFGPKVQVLTATHPLAAAERAAGPELARPITIGPDAWIGAGAIICPGVTIGEAAVIGAGAVVTRDVPAGMLAVGNPARGVRSVSETAPSDV